MSDRYKSISQLSELTGLDRATIRKRLRDVKPQSVEVKRTIYDTHVALPAIFLKFDEKKINEELIVEQLRYETARADKATIEVEKLKKEVVPINDVAKVVADEYSRVRARLYAIPSRAASDLAESTNPRECQQIVHSEIDEALAELTADKKYQEITHVDEPNEQIEGSQTEESQAVSET